MEIHEQTVSPWTILLILGLVVIGIAGIGILGWSGALDLHLGASPEQQANARVIDQIAAQATATAMRIENEKNQQLAEIQVQEEAQSSKSRAQMIQTLTWFVSAAAVLMFLGLAALVFNGTRYAWRLASLPAARPVADKVYVVETVEGPMLVDTLTGQRALLRSPAGVSRLRGQIMERLLLADRMVQISKVTRSASPADWLPQLTMQKPGEGRTGLRTPARTDQDQDR